MQAKEIYLDNKNILGDGTLGIYWTNRDWRNNLQVRDVSTPREGGHGRDVSATFAEFRVITLAGYIDRMTNENNFEAVKYLENMFSLQSNPSILKPRILKVVDIYDRVWEMAVKVKDPVEFTEWDQNFEGSHWAWFTTLESVGDPTFVGVMDEVVIGKEWYYGGFTMPVDGRNDLGDGWQFHETYNGIKVVPSGNGAVYPRFEIITQKEINSPLRIRNVSTGASFVLDVSARAGDIIIIDTKTQKITKNGENIAFLRLPWSVWMVANGETEFVVDDVDGGLYESDFDVKVSFRSTLL